MLWISEWPRSLVYPGFLSPVLLSTGIQRSFSLICTPMRSDQAARDIRKKKVEHISDQAQRAKIGQIEDASQTAEYHDVLQQEADLTAGHGILRYTGLIAISAPTIEELDAHVAAIEQAAIQASCEIRLLVDSKPPRSPPPHSRCVGGSKGKGVGATQSRSWGSRRNSSRAGRLILASTLANSASVSSPSIEGSVTILDISSCTSLGGSSAIFDSTSAMLSTSRMSALRTILICSSLNARAAIAARYRAWASALDIFGRGTAIAISAED